MCLQVIPLQNHNLDFYFSHTLKMFVLLFNFCLSTAGGVTLLKSWLQSYWIWIMTSILSCNVLRLTDRFWEEFHVRSIPFSSMFSAMLGFNWTWGEILIEGSRERFSLCLFKELMYQWLGTDLWNNINNSISCLITHGFWEW